MTLDELLWKDTENISVKKLWEYLCTYCYLPRLSSYSVLQETICQGCASDEYFGIAAAHNGERYVGLKWNQSIFNFNNTDLLVKPSAAKAQIKEEAEAQAAAGSQATSGGTSSGFTPSGSGMHTGTSSEGAGTPGGTGAATPPTAANRHFYMSADVDAVRVNRVISTYVDEIIRHLMQVEGANVQLKLLSVFRSERALRIICFESVFLAFYPGGCLQSHTGQGFSSCVFSCQRAKKSIVLGHFSFQFELCFFLIWSWSIPVGASEIRCSTRVFAVSKTAATDHSRHESTKCEQDSKSVDGSNRPGVRIPPSPPEPAVVIPLQVFIYASCSSFPGRLNVSVNPAVP